jgi:hypothetical protein
MGSNKIGKVRSQQIISLSHFNQYRTALDGHVYPRNATGAVESGAGSLGTSQHPWNNLHLNTGLAVGATLNGNNIVPSGNNLIIQQNFTAKLTLDNTTGKAVFADNYVPDNVKAQMPLGTAAGNISLSGILAAQVVNTTTPTDITGMTLSTTGNPVMIGMIGTNGVGSIGGGFPIGSWIGIDQLGLTLVRYWARVQIRLSGTTLMQYDILRQHGRIVSSGNYHRINSYYPPPTIIGITDVAAGTHNFRVFVECQDLLTEMYLQNVQLYAVELV